MNKRCCLIILLLCVAVLPSAMAQTYVWRFGPGDSGENVPRPGEINPANDFRGSHLENMWNLSGNYDNTNWEGSIFSSMNIHASFRGANLRNVRMEGIIDPMTGSDFTDADITGATLPLNAEQLFSTRNFKEKNLVGVAITEIFDEPLDLSGVSFAGFDLTGARLHGIFEGADFTDADITRSVIVGIGGSGLTLEQLKTTRNYQNKDLSGVTFTRNNFDNANFRGFTLGVFHHCSLVDADLTDAVFVGEGFRGKGFVYSPITRQQFESTRTFKEKDLSGMTFVGMNLDGWNFRDTNLDRANLLGSSLLGADFTGASIQGTSFNPHWYGRPPEIYTGLTNEQWQSTRTYQDWKKGDVPLPNLNGIDLSNSDFSGMSDFSGHQARYRYTLHDANLTNANFSDTTLDRVTFYNCDLTGANFTNATFQNVSFWGSNLAWEQFRSTTNGKNRDFSGVTFETGGSFIGWDFSNADLTRMRFGTSDLTGSIFENATIDLWWSFPSLVINQTEDAGHGTYGLTREQFESTANFRSKVLIRAKFHNSDLRNMDFSGFDLTGAHFSCTFSSHARFSQNEQEQIMRILNRGPRSATNFAGANFEDAIIRNSSFYGNFNRETNFTKEQFYSTACYKNGVIEGVEFINMDLTDWDFSRVRLVRVRFINCIGVEHLNL